MWQYLIGLKARTSIPTGFIRAVLDSRTNVFNMGATAFVLLGGELDRSIEKWEAGHELYQVVCKAVETNRNQRYQSLSDFYLAWNDARNGNIV